MTGLWYDQLAFPPRISNDPTCCPPPCYSQERSREIYGPAFRRVMEYVTLCKVPGDVVEFGTFCGHTARWLAELMAELKHPGALWMYDSWAGFPKITSPIDIDCYEVATNQAWVEGLPNIGAPPGLIQASIASVLGDTARSIIRQGWYSDTLAHENLPAASIVHIDCDLYESTLTVLGEVLGQPAVAQGSVLLFDDWNNNRASNKFGERRALKVALARFTDFEVEPWFSYGWHGQAFFVHEV